MLDAARTGFAVIGAGFCRGSHRALVLAWQISARREPGPMPKAGAHWRSRSPPIRRSGRGYCFEHRDFERHGDGAPEYAQTAAAHHEAGSRF